MKTVFTFITLFTFIAISSCQQDDANPDDNKIIQMDEKSAKVVEADNSFGLEIFQKLRIESKEENIMVSPLSISVALAMAYNGASGDTKAEMEKTLKRNGLTTEQINASYKFLIEALQSLDKDVVFEIANAIFYAQGFSVKPDFISTNQNIYGAKVESLNFGSPAAVETINNWVAGKTRDKIQKIIEQLNPLDRMVLLNAIYFNGIWTNKFDKDGTHLLNFDKIGGTTKEIPMMKKEDRLEYASNSMFSSVQMPYGKGQYKMIVMLPAENKTSQDIIDNLNINNWNYWMGTYKITERVVVTMPRFKFAFEIGLNDVLTKMGMIKAFIPDVADFSKISDQHLYISSAKHKSFIDVNETGTEAAAITSITFSTTSIENEPPKTHFLVNKPFVFAITEKDTGAILFIGEVRNPEYN